MISHQPHLTPSGAYVYDCRTHNWHVWSVNRQLAVHAIQDHDRRHHDLTDPGQGAGSAK